MAMDESALAEISVRHETNNHDQPLLRDYYLLCNDGVDNSCDRRQHTGIMCHGIPSHDGARIFCRKLTNNQRHRPSSNCPSMTSSPTKRR